MKIANCLMMNINFKPPAVTNLQSVPIKKIENNTSHKPTPTVVIFLNNRPNTLLTQLYLQVKSCFPYSKS